MRVKPARARWCFAATNGTLIDINVSQQAYPEGEEYHYKLPVIFHVLYKNRADNRQYVKYDRLVKLLDEVNQIYRGERKYIQGEEGVDMNLEFVLATTNEEGEQLEKPGVEYIQVDQMPISCLAFADDPDAVKYLWDPNKYINVMLYNFDDVQDGGAILGLSNLPYTLSGQLFGRLATLAPLLRVQREPLLSARGEHQ